MSESLPHWGEVNVWEQIKEDFSQICVQNTVTNLLVGNHNKVMVEAHRGEMDGHEKKVADPAKGGEGASQKPGGCVQ